MVCHKQKEGGITVKTSKDALLKGEKADTVTMLGHFWNGEVIRASILS